MYIKLALASLMIFVFNKPYAQVTIDTTGGTTGGAITSTPISNSVSTTGASTSQGGAGGLGGSGGLGGTSNAATGASTSAGNTSGNTTVTSNYASPKIPVATAFAPSNFPTAPCMGSTSIGGSAVLFGFSAGSSWEATECMTFEAARSFDQAGMHEDALAIKCTSKYSAAAPSCIKLRQQEEQRSQSERQTPYDQKMILNTSLARGIYSETIDPVSGFKTIIDTRDTIRRAVIP
ncbi:hypothetical protein ICN19_05280 [Polynucleobacter sp. AP-Capit-er-40B-B4]|uniref:hypothetical protein n=1 Tax=Polynucleobacter sp. AP-Capit-er-40B-B4 TaxID=2576927 RepID=UPI001C0CDF98|nr:hypothetical protein [Polynucleobacter sp. AP-Capit-er-40B-B4]MBU3581423.1 hypothetical protein [Polynucleobacter sp. AP-Capit-er-40B-B4]